MSSKQEIKVSITGEATGLNQTLRGVSGGLSGLGKELSALQGLAARALNFGAIGGAVSVAGLVAVTRAVAESAASMSRLATIAGTTSESFTGLSYAAERHGMSAEKLADIYKDVQDKIGDFLQNGGGPMKDFFDNIAPKVGVTAAQFAALSGPEALQLYYTSLERANLSQAETVFYMEALATDATALIPLLRDNGAGFAAAAAEAKAFGLIVSAETTAAANEFRENLIRLKAAQDGLVTQLAAELMPAFRDASAAMVDVAKNSGLIETVSQAAIVVFQTLAVTGANVAFVFRGIGREIGGIAAQMAALVAGDIDGFRAIGQAMREDAAAARQDLDAFEARIMAIGQTKAADEAKYVATKQAQKKLEQEIIALAKLRQQEAKKAGDEEIKGAERLRDALKAAWQASIDGARKARDEAQKLFQAAADARLTGQDKADDRRSRGLSPEEQGAQAAQQGEAARNAASMAALQAKLAAMRGDSAAVEKLSAEALKQAQRAEQFADKIPDDNSAADLLEEVAKIRETAIAAQAQAKQAQAAALDEQAQAQAKTLADLETRIAELKKAAGEITVNVQIAEAESRIAKLKAEIEKGAVMPVTVQQTGGAAQPEILDVSPYAPGYASGGIIRGPGSGTSDSILARLSNGEGVIRNRAVAFYGENLIHRINSLQLPKFANGGIVGGASRPGATVNLSLDGRSYPMSASPDVAAALADVVRMENLRRGKRR